MLTLQTYYCLPLHHYLKLVLVNCTNTVYTCLIVMADFFALSATLRFLVLDDLLVFVQCKNTASTNGVISFINSSLPELKSWPALATLSNVVWTAYKRSTYACLSLMAIILSICCWTFLSIVNVGTVYIQCIYLLRISSTLLLHNILVVHVLVVLVYIHCMNAVKTLL